MPNISNAMKQMCSAGGSVPRYEFKLISTGLNSPKQESLKSLWIPKVESKGQFLECIVGDVMKQLQK